MNPLMTCEIPFSPVRFVKSNLDAFESGIIPAVVRHIPEGSSVAELYSGAFLFKSFAIYVFYFMTTHIVYYHMERFYFV